MWWVVIEGGYGSSEGRGASKRGCMWSTKGPFGCVPATLLRSVHGWILEKCGCVFRRLKPRQAALLQQGLFCYCTFEKSRGGAHEDEDRRSRLSHPRGRGEEEAFSVHERRRGSIDEGLKDPH